MLFNRLQELNKEILGPVRKPCNDSPSAPEIGSVCSMRGDPRLVYCAEEMRVLAFRVKIAASIVDAAQLLIARASDLVFTVKQTNHDWMICW